MKFSELVSRLNGISTPIGGVSWKPAQSDVEVARRVLTFLEDRRVLFSSYANEIPDHCVASVLDIRRFLTDQLAAGGIGQDLAGHLKGMRGACRQFLDAQQSHTGHHGGMMDPWFNQSLGELRASVGARVQEIAVRYGLDVPDTLASALPPADEDG